MIISHGYRADSSVELCGGNGTLYNAVLDYRVGVPQTPTEQVLLSYLLGFME